MLAVALTVVSAFGTILALWLDEKFGQQLAAGSDSAMAAITDRFLANRNEIGLWVGGLTIVLVGVLLIWQHLRKRGYVAGPISLRALFNCVNSPAYRSALNEIHLLQHDIYRYLENCRIGRRLQIETRVGKDEVIVFLKRAQKIANMATGADLSRQHQAVSRRRRSEI
jgi:hypothetical protein